MFFFSSRRRHTRYWRDWSSDVCSSDLAYPAHAAERRQVAGTDPRARPGAAFPSERFAYGHGSRGAPKHRHAAEVELLHGSGNFRDKLCVSWCERGQLTMAAFFLWCLLLVFCWPIALLAVFAYSILWLVLLPFPRVGNWLPGGFAVLLWPFFLPLRSF